MVTITGIETKDVRFPVGAVFSAVLRVSGLMHEQTSLDKTGSDAMNAAGDYSAAYCILSTDSEFSGHGMVLTPPTFPASIHLLICIDLHNWPR